MKVTFWGVRGSIPVPGPATCRYGGNTTCVEVSAGDAVLVLDCGTGASALGRSLVLRHVAQVEVLFTHFHMDHVFGFPFFGPLYTPGCRVGVTIPSMHAEEAESRLSRYLNGVYHPVRLRDVSANLTLRHVRGGRPFERSGFEIEALRLHHPGGAHGYRITHGGRTLVFLTDTAPLAGLDEGVRAGRPPPASEARVLEAMEDADLVIMDTMFSFEEYLSKMTWGHAYPEYAVALCEAARVRRLALFHHAPEASDDDLDALGARWADHETIEILVAREGGSVDLEG